MRRGCSGSLLLNIILTILGWLPGVLHAWIVILAEPSHRHRSRTSHSSGHNHHSSSYAGRHHHSHHHHGGHGHGHGHGGHHRQGHTGRHHARPARRSYGYDREPPMMGYRDDGYAAPPMRPVSGYGAPPPPPEMGYIPPPGRSRY